MNQIFNQVLLPPWGMPMGSLCDSREAAPDRTQTWQRQKINSGCHWNSCSQQGHNSEFVLNRNLAKKKKGNVKGTMLSQVGIYFEDNKPKNGALEINGSQPRKAVWNIFVVSLIWHSGNERELRKHLKVKAASCHKALSICLFLCITISTHNCFSKFFTEVQ